MIQMELEFRELEVKLAALARRMDNMKPVMEEIREYLIVSTKDRFKAGQSPDGAAWAPKSQTTLDAYRSRGDKADPRPLFGPTRRLSSEISGRAWRDGLEVGSALIQAAVMHFGAKKGEFGSDRHGRPIPWGNIPARAFIGLSEKDERTIIDIVEDALGDELA
jgi:phage virion morphogenesis protein